MVISQTPLRISFAGGGTDLPSFYEPHGGAVLSSAVNLYIYLAIHSYFEDRIQLKYSKTENVASVDEVEHPIIRACLSALNQGGPIEITSFADIPAKGTGLGSSSSFAVGLLKAVYAHQGHDVGAAKCAETACHVEIDMLGEPIGKQDQYAAAFGGLNLIQFRSDGVFVEPVIVSRERKLEFQDHLVMFYTGLTRQTRDILTEQKANIENDTLKTAHLAAMRDQTYAMRDAIVAGDFRLVGEILNTGWELKRKMASGISCVEIDELYAKGVSAGAYGGKLLGAGGGGFLMFVVPPAKMQAVMDAFKGMRMIRPCLDGQGSRIIYTDN